MFNKNNFCHIASNNRNEKKAGVFVYKTTDNIAAVSVSGYFNDKIIDINLHDLIIHEWHDPADRTKVERNVLCVTERTLDNVGTTLIKSKIEGDIEQEIADLQTYVENNFVRTNGTSTMTGTLRFETATGMKGGVGAYYDGLTFYKVNQQGDLVHIAFLSDEAFAPTVSNVDLGKTDNKFRDLILSGKVNTATINNGSDLAVPDPGQADTIALKSQVDLAANSGSQLRDKGVWYAKMDSATTPPPSAGVEGRNYADFSQVDGTGNPIIVIYTYTSGAWVQTETITPPASYNGYLPVTSKFWDIQEQTGQQGGLVLWSYSAKTFTPYPRIISTDGIAITNSTFSNGTLTNVITTMPASPIDKTVVNKKYVDDALLNHGTGRNVGDVFFTMRKDSGLNGAVECNGGTYDTTDFTGAESIGDLLEDGKVPYVSLANYATALATDGVVGVFGWDGTGTTTFRVPSLNDIFVEVGTAAQIGDYLPAGLPNIKGTFGVGPYTETTSISLRSMYATGAFGQGSDVSAPAHVQGSGGYSTSPRGTTFDASRSSSVYSDSVSTVQPKTVRYRAMVQLMISATDEAVATCTALTSQVAANTSAINGADYVVETQLPTAANDYTWYRKYKSGWVEQGGIITIAAQSANSGITTTVDLPVEMSDTNYYVAPLTFITDGGSTTGLRNHANERTTTQLKIKTWSTTTVSNSYTAAWEIKGVAAQ